MIPLPRKYAPEQRGVSDIREMGSLADDGDVVEDRFDDQSFDDAPLSDRESNFDEMELRDCEQLHQPTDQIYSQNNWFNQSRFEKENSWEPSILEHSSFENTDQGKFAESLPVPSVPKLDGDHGLKSREGYLNRDSNTSVERNDATVRVIEALIAKATSRKRHNDLAEKFNGLSVIMPEDSSISVERSIAETTASTNLSVGKIQNVLKGVPPSSSPRTLMKVLDEYKRSRVKARKAGDHPLPPPILNIEPSLSSCTSRHLPSHKACNSAGAMKPDIGVACKDVKAPCEGELLDSQILLLDAHRTVPLRIEFSPTQNARFSTYLLIAVEGGGGPQVNYRMPVRGLGGTAVVTVKARDDLRISRNGIYILQSSYESTFSFSLTNSGNRRAFSRVVVLCTTESGVLEHIPADIRPSPGIVIDRSESKERIFSSFMLLIYWFYLSLNVLSYKTFNLSPYGFDLLCRPQIGGLRKTLLSPLRQQRFENLKGISHLCEGIRFTDTFVGEDPTFRPPEDHPITKEDVRLFDQTLRMCTIYVCSPRIRPGSSLISNYSSPFERSLQPEDTFRERSTYKVAVPDLTLR
ncbi:unnamed protein product [Angiostrongylus costaricensis]|uniref:Deleted in lung and esophageal cancer protein 1 n=1 Tax=Angiostrongylus costaricensis TaxID=334426 RepID=A0A158PM01_ANGCS|nr:unnamed protein product [Angiostrongylus costaricensis]